MPPVAATFETALAFVGALCRDGRFDDSAPGETFVTHYGVTQMTWDFAASHGIVSGSFAAATPEQCAAVMRALYWNAMHCSSFQPGVNLMLFNDSVLSGTGHVASLVARIVGSTVPPTSVIGPDILRRANSFGAKRLIDAIAAGDDAYFAALRTAPLFLHGWERREADAQRLAYQMAGIAG